MIFVTSTRGARAPGGANGDRGGRLSPAPTVAALPPPAVASRLGGFFFRPSSGILCGHFLRTARQDCTQTWLHYRIAPAIGRRFFCRRSFRVPTSARVTADGGGADRPPPTPRARV